MMKQNRSNWKKWLSALMAVTMLTSVVVTSAAASESVATEGLAKKDVHITLLATSDIHGRSMPWDYASDAPNPSGSLTQLFTAIQQIRQENPNTILVDVGDMIQDNSAELFNSEPQSPMMVAMNAMGYDAWIYGNHEFNFGLDVLDKVSSQFEGVRLAGNVYKDNGERLLPAYTIIEKEGVKVGLIGMTTPLIPDFEKGTDHVKGLVFTDPVEETKKVIEELTGQVDVMIGVMHMGLDNENNTPHSGVRDIANGNPELAAIFAGHMHALVNKEEVNGVLITEPNKYGTHLSRIDLHFSQEDGKMVLTSKDANTIPVVDPDGNVLASDPGLEEILKPFHEFARQDANTVVGRLVGENLVPPNEIEGIPQVQIQQTLLSDFFADVMQHYSQADVVAFQIDNDKARLDVGDIKKKDIAYNYQFTFGEVTNYQVTGKDLKDYMEWAVGYFNSTRKGDVTVSFDLKRRSSKYSTNDFFGNIKYDIDLRKPYGQRITNLRRLDDSPIQATDSLVLGMNAYRMDALVAQGGALEGRTFEQLWSSKDNSAFGEMGGTIRNLAIKYIKEEKKGVLEQKAQNRWKIVGVETDAPERTDVIELVNAGILKVPATEDGKFTNVASINILDDVQADEVKALAEKANVDVKVVAGAKNKGELYSRLNAAYQAAQQNTTPATEMPAQPDKAAKPESDKAKSDTGKPNTSKPDTGKPAQSVTPAKPASQVTVTAYYLNVRNQASPNSKIVAVVKKGTILEVTGKKDGWIQIAINGKTAYVDGMYVK